MADNVLPSVDPNVATDDVSGVHFQKVKIADGTADSSTIVPATTPADGAAAEVALATKGYAMLWNGSTWDRVPGNTSGQFVQGPVAHDAPVGGNPVLMGAYASTGAPTNVTAGDAVRLWAALDGALAVNVKSMPSPTSVSAIGSISHDGAASSYIPVLVGGYANAAAPADVSNDVDAVRAWYLRNGAQATVLTAAGALVGGDATNGLDVDVTRLPALPTGTNNIGDVDVLTVPAPLSTTGGGTEATALRVTVANDSTGLLGVDGDVAHDAADSGNPVKMGMQARNALPTAVANADRVNAAADLFGRQMVTHIDPAQAVHKSFNATTTQTGIDVWDPAGGMRIAVTSVVIGVYGTTAGRVILWFGDNADTTYTAGTDQVLLAASFAPSATAKPGLVYTPAVPVFCTTADRELHITTDAGISIDVTVEGYEW